MKGTAPDPTLVGEARGEGSAAYIARKAALAAGGISECEYRVDSKLGMVSEWGKGVSEWGKGAGVRLRDRFFTTPASSDQRATELF